MTAQRDPLWVLGTGQTGPTPEDPRSISEMVLEAVESALTDASLGFVDIDAIVTGSVDLHDGLTASSIAVTEVVGAVMRPETRIAGDGLCALVHAACQLWAGAYERVLVVAHGKASMAPQDAIERWAMDPIYLQPLGVSFAVVAGLVARLLADGPQAGSDPLERWATIASTRRRAAESEQALTPDEVLASPVVASPLTEAMCAPVADAACAVVLSRRGSGVAVTGVGHDLAAHAPGQRDLGRWRGARRALDRASQVAGLDAPRFDLFEPSCRYPHEEELFLDALELPRDTALSLNGGLFGGVAPVAAGLSRLVTAAQHMREHPESKRALAHGAWGPAAQGHVMAILEANP